MFAEDYRLLSSNQMRGAARFLVQSATRHFKPVNGLASTPSNSSKFDSQSNCTIPNLNA